MVVIIIAILTTNSEMTKKYVLILFHNYFIALFLATICHYELRHNIKLWFLTVKQDGLDNFRNLAIFCIYLFESLWFQPDEDSSLLLTNLKKRRLKNKKQVIIIIASFFLNEPLPIYAICRTCHERVNAFIYW